MFTYRSIRQTARHRPRKANADAESVLCAGVERVVRAYMRIDGVAWTERGVAWRSLRSERETPVTTRLQEMGAKVNEANEPCRLGEANRRKKEAAE